jgi:hypothetical protein
VAEITDVEDELSLFRDCIKNGFSDAKITEEFVQKADPSKNIYPKLIEHISLHRKKSKKTRESHNRTNDAQVQSLISHMRSDYAQLDELRCSQDCTTNNPNSGSISSQTLHTSNQASNNISNSVQQASANIDQVAVLPQVDLAANQIKMLIPPMAIAIPNSLASANFLPASGIIQNNKRKIEASSSAANDAAPKKSRNPKTCKSFRIDPEGHVYICGRTSEFCTGSTRAGVCTYEAVKETEYKVRVNEVPRSKLNK